MRQIKSALFFLACASSFAASGIHQSFANTFCKDLLEDNYRATFKLLERKHVKIKDRGLDPPQFEIATTGDHPLNKFAKEFFDKTGHSVAAGRMFGRPGLDKGKVFGLPLNFFESALDATNQDLRTLLSSALGTALNEHRSTLLRFKRDEFLNLLNFRFNQIGIGLKLISEPYSITIELHSLEAASPNAKFFKLASDAGAVVVWNDTIARFMERNGSAGGYDPRKKLIYLSHDLFFGWDLFEKSTYFHEMAHANFLSSAIKKESDSPFLVLAVSDEPSSELKELLRNYSRHFSFEELYTFEKDINKWLSQNRIKEAQLRAKTLERFIAFAKTSTDASLTSIQNDIFKVRFVEETIQVKVPIEAYESKTDLIYTFVSSELKDLARPLKGFHGFFDRLFHPARSAQNRRAFRQALAAEIEKRKTLIKVYEKGYQSVSREIDQLKDGDVEQIKKIKEHLHHLREDIAR